MRIIAGHYGGRRLETPKNQDIRPTSDKIRGAIFNTLGSMDALENATVLDLFCGTGALGLEALSRGAKLCTFFDKNRASLDICKANIESIGAAETHTVLKDSTKLGANEDKKATLVFIDPPYHKNFIEPVLERLHEGEWLDENAVLVIESEKNWSRTSLEAYTQIQEKIYGDTKITYLRYTKNPE